MESECSTSDSSKLDYLRNNFHVTLFIKEAGFRLKLSEATTATACVLYHKFISKIENQDDFELNVVGCTALYLAGKAEETMCRLRDVINICYSTLNKDKPALEITSKYWELRESVVKCELLCLRLLGFQVTVDHPHKYLLHYLKILEDWIDDRTWSASKLPQFCWCTLNDTFHTTLCIEEPPATIAVAVVYFALSCTGLQIPTDTPQEDWWKVFCRDLCEEDLFRIVNTILDMYDYERDMHKVVPPPANHRPRGLNPR